MTPIRLVIALTALCAASTRFGWGDLVTGTCLLGLLMVLLQVARRARFLHRGFAVPARRNALADAVLAVAAAASGGRGGLDLYAEAVGMLDDMAESGASGVAIVSSALVLGIRMPRQAEIRRRSPVASPTPERSGRRARRTTPATLVARVAFLIVGPAMALIWTAYRERKIDRQLAELNQQLRQADLETIERMIAEVEANMDTPRPAPRSLFGRWWREIT